MTLVCFVKKIKRVQFCQNGSILNSLIILTPLLTEKTFLMVEQIWEDNTIQPDYLY